MEKVKVLIWGFGAMGSGMARMLLKKQGVEITGICDTHPDRVNKNFKDVINFKSDHKDLVISGNIDEVMTNLGGIFGQHVDIFANEKYKDYLILQFHPLVYLYL